MRRISDPSSLGLLTLLFVLLAVAAGSVSWLTGRQTDRVEHSIADTRPSGDWIETRSAWIPTTADDWLERLNGPSKPPVKRGNALLDSGQSPRQYSSPLGVTRVPAVGSRMATPAPSSAETAKSGRSAAGGAKKIAARKSGDDEDDEDESPWTKEESRGTYRTLCVRLCDGYFFPISFATTKDNFARDAKVCERSCKSPARLFFHENPGQAPEDMEDARGKRYKDLKVAFSHQKQYDEACTCKAQPWDEAALARHRQFAEAAERRKGGKKDNNRRSRLEQVSLTIEQTEHPTGQDSFELEQALLPPALVALGIKRRQSLVPAHLSNSSIHLPRHKIALLQTPVTIATHPRQCRPGMAIDASTNSIVDAPQTGRRSPAAAADGAAQPSRSRPTQAKASGQNAARGAGSGAVSTTPATNPSGKKIADGAETQVR